jgi:hypothetical protein
MRTTRFIVACFSWLSLFAVSACAPCPFERVSDSPHVQVGQWVVDIWAQSCGLGGGGGMEIRAVNQHTKETKTIVVFSYIDAKVTAASNAPNVLTITLPNRIDISDAVTELGEIKIIYNFVPRDDPEDRANFQNWWRHQDDPNSRAWYCQNILAKMDPINRDMWNKAIGQSYPADAKRPPKYCPNL